MPLLMRSWRPSSWTHTLPPPSSLDETAPTGCSSSSSRERERPLTTPVRPFSWVEPWREWILTRTNTSVRSPSGMCVCVWDFGAGGRARGLERDGSVSLARALEGRPSIFGCTFVDEPYPGYRGTCTVGESFLFLAESHLLCTAYKSSAKKPRRNHSGSTTALTTRAPTRLSLRPSRTVDRCSHHLVRPHSLQPLRGLSCTQGFKIPRQMSVSPRSMPRRRLPNDKSRAWKCPRSLTLRCAGGVATCMDEWECIDRIQARGDLHWLRVACSPMSAISLAASSTHKTPHTPLPY